MTITTISGKPQLNRKINMSIVLDLIKREGSLSRADLVKRTGIKAASMSAIVQQLVDEKLIIQTGLGKSSGGRQPTMLELNPSGLYAVGIEVEENSLNAILVNFTSTIMEKTHCSLPNTQPQTVIEAIATVVDTLCSAGKVSRDKLAGIGIAVPGIINTEEGRVILSRSMDWHNEEISKKVSASLGLKIRVLNNALAGALAAYDDQSEPATRSLLFVLVHLLHDHTTALGCGIVLNGRAYIGDGSRAGEIHVDIDHPLARARALLGEEAPATVEELVTLSREEPDRYKSVWESFAKELGVVVSRGIDFLNPGKVIIGVDIPEAEALIGDKLRKEAHSSYSKDKDAAMGLIEDFLAPPIEFMTTETETLAKGAIVPHLQELSLAPSLRQGVLI